LIPSLMLLLATPSYPKPLLVLDPSLARTGVIPCQEEGLVSCVLAQVDISAFDDNVLLLPNGVELARKNYIQESGDRSGMVEEVTSIAYSTRGVEAIFSYRNNRVMGNIKYDNGTDFSLEPCSNFTGCHVWKEDEKVEILMKKDGRSVSNRELGTKVALTEKMKKLVQKGKADDTTVVEFSIRFYYTKEFVKATSDVTLFFNQVLAVTNQGFRNSKIPVKAKIFCIEATTLTDQAEADDLRKNFEKLKGAGVAGRIALLDTADAAALFVVKTNQAGLGQHRGWDSNNTLTVNVKRHSFTSFVFGHEIGHNFGCEHDPKTEPKNKYYNYGYGSLINPKYLTIMGYPSGKYENVINYYSNPKVLYKGVATGTKTQDNARVIKENRFAMAAVGDESGTCSTATTSTARATTATTTTAAPTTAATSLATTTQITEDGEGEGPSTDDFEVYQNY